MKPSASMNRWTLATALASTAALAPTLAQAAAPDKAACVAADDQAQAQRKAGKMSAARTSLNICISASCPAPVRADCGDRLDELEHAQPTFVVVAKDPNGADLSAVRVFVDGVKVADQVGGQAIQIDPGEHDLRFETDGQKPVSRHVIIRESVHGREEDVRFGDGAPPAIAPVSTATTTTTTTSNTTTPPPDGDPNAGSTQRTLGIVGIGVGAAGVAAGVIFGLVASSKWSSAKNLCSDGNCPTANRAEAVDDRSSAVTFGTLSTVGFIAGGALAAGGAILYFTAPKASSSGPSVGLAPTLGGAVLRGSF